MAVPLKEKRFTTLLLVVLIGILIGSFINSMVEMVPGENVVKTFFTYAITFGVGDFVNNNPILIDFNAIRFHLGFQIRFSALSVLGVIVSLYIFRWYK